MRLLRAWLVRLGGLFRRESGEREMAEEIESHLQLHIEDNLRAGMTPEQARRQALIKLGGVEPTKEIYRERRSLPLLETLWQDARFGARQLRQNPGFTAVAVLTLALGIGANTAILSLVDGILLRPLPYPQPERLVVLLQSYPSVGLNRWGISQFLFANLREQARSFVRSAAHTSAGLNLTTSEEPVRLRGAYVTAGFFETLGVRPARGRAFLPEEDVPGKNVVCILSDRLWRSRFGGDPNIVGRSLRLNDAPLQVVGVMPPEFQFPSPETDLWIPLGLDPGRRFGFMFAGIARLKDGVPAARAEAETTGIQWNLARQSENPPPPGADMKMIVTPLHEAVTQRAKKPLLVLLGAVGLVLLIACANIANLLLGRVTARRREIALRIALGASARRIVAQLLTESLLLAALGAMAGAALAVWLVALIARLPLEGIPRVAEVQVNTTALLFAAAVALATGFLFGLAPAVHAYRLGLGAGLREGTRSTASVSSRRLNDSLVAGQVALSLLLLIAAGLLLKSFAQLLAVNPGFQPENLLTMRISLSERSYDSPERMIQFYEALLERVRTLPGVRAAGMISKLPVQADGGDADGYVVEGREHPGPVQPNALMHVASPGYLQALGIPLLRGRDFSSADRADTEPVAIVDATLARLYWPDGNALGKRIRFGWDTSDRAWMTIVGVAGNVKHAGLAEAWYPHLYMPERQRAERLQAMHLAVRTTADPSTVTTAIRAQVRALDANVPVFAVRTMPEIVAQSLNSQRLTNILLGSFAVTALLLAAVGIHGVMSLSVNGSTQEFGIRMALGAQPGDVFRLVVGEGMGIAAAGMAAGVLGALAVTRFLRTLLFETSPFDPATFVGVTLVLGSAAFAACYVPARRATRVDPMVTLRCE
jgi:putative ABC transport system permease protein